jgi:hypothetical protein
MLKNVLASGTCKEAVHFDKWFKLQLSVVADKADGYVGSYHLFTVTVPATVKAGFAAYGTMPFGYVDFDNWSINAAE